MNRLIVLAMLLTLTLSACVQSRTMVSHRATDNIMSCGETAQRLGELDALKRLTLKEKNSKNMVAGVLFFPAITGNQKNVSDTINAINKRNEVLGDIYQANECVSDIPFYSIDQIRVRIEKNQVLELQV